MHVYFMNYFELYKALNATILDPILPVQPALSIIERYFLNYYNMNHFQTVAAVP